MNMWVCHGHNRTCHLSSWKEQLWRVEAEDELSLKSPCFDRERLQASDDVAPLEWTHTDDRSTLCGTASSKLWLYA